MLAALAVALGPAAGCATAYVYRPLGPPAPPAGGDDGLVARYPVPPEAPQGEVLVTSFGVTNVNVAPGTEAPMLHVRLGASVGASAPIPWTLDAREQVASLVGGRPQPPTYANSDAGGPVMTVAPGQQRVLDLYYALPPGRGGDRDVPGFDLAWTIHIVDRVVADRTPFQRAEAPPDHGPPRDAYLAVGLGWSPYWWYGPFYPFPRIAVGFRPSIVHYAPPYRVRGGAPAGSWRGRPVAPAGGSFRGTPVGRSGGFRGAPTGGGFRGRPAR